MSIKFVTNSISTSTKFPTLSEIIKVAQTKATMEKNASAGKTLEKTADKGDFGGKKAPPFGSKKEEKDCKDKDSEKEEKDCKDKDSKKKEKICKPCRKASKDQDEGQDSGQPKAEANLVNDPHKDPKLKDNKSGGGSSKKEEGESSGQLDVEPCHQKGESTGEKKTDTSAQRVRNSWVKVANLTDKQKEFLRKTWQIYWPKSFMDALLADK